MRAGYLLMISFWLASGHSNKALFVVNISQRILCNCRTGFNKQQYLPTHDGDRHRFRTAPESSPLLRTLMHHVPRSDWDWRTLALEASYEAGVEVGGYLQGDDRRRQTTPSANEK